MTEGEAPPVAQPAKPKRAKKQRPPSRSQRWANACAEAREALDKFDSVYGELETALGELQSIREEYQEWRDNLPENLANSALGEKLETVCDMDFEVNPRSESFDDMDTLISEAENAELPQGFGRD